MRITVASTNARGESSEWGYVTLFDGIFRTVEAQENAETAVEVVDDRSARILNSWGGRVHPVIIDTSPRTETRFRTSTCASTRKGGSPGSGTPRTGAS